MPIQLKHYEAYNKALKTLWFSDKDNSQLLIQIIQKLIHKIEIGVDKVVVHYRVGKKIKRESEDSLFKIFKSSQLL